jgi:spermidine synthase
MRENPPKMSNLRIGVIGLGVGTLAAYGQAGDYIRFYEINPQVIRIASDPQYFTYLQKSPSKLKIITGDARLSMEAELSRNESQDFDLLVVDAFSGDAPPVHLLTREAFEIYLKELKPTGIIAVNITNTFIDLQPVIAALAENMGLSYTVVHSDGDGRISLYCDWVLLSKASLTDRLGSVAAAPAKSQRALRLWTDAYSNLFAILR